MSLLFKDDAMAGDVNMNVVLYGPPKTGKTLGAASAPGPVLYLNCDLDDATRLAHKRYPAKIQEVDLSGGVLRALYDITTALRDPASPFETVVVDPIGDLYRRLLDESNNNALRATLPQRGDVSVHIERFCRALCEIDVNVVLVAHELVGEKDEVTGYHERLPFCGTSNPKLAEKLMGMVNVVGFTGCIEDKDAGNQYVAQLYPAGGRRGGDRWNVLGNVRTLNLTEWHQVIQTAGAVDEAVATTAGGAS